ncbi:ABC transporter substrate-binding protein [Actinoplanes cyaneus]|uniref:ABC transporter substrate-binding protein n=1 Tax=Actinoplanes cyaneus TaxID=52696 RepID=A0A919IIV2_9ACTN|nr:ABC transporter substrate-binding protein [Actinoplanes cyaneus]MCW2138315.1 ABC-type branched-chain amino acid transport system, substrate-binding protein [Actinoplanes cyaneus]GID66273.1 ABC transporter substrate-binding protein [Actinoplanes cyaneus]
MKRTTAVFLAVLLFAGACDGSSTSSSSGGTTPGVTDTEIVLGTHMPLTGPAAAGYSKIAPATKAYFDFVNAGGGINGRKITYKVKDDAYNPATTQQVVRELVLQDKVFAIMGGLGTPTHSGVLDFLKTNKVPDLFVASGSRSWNQPDKYPGTFGFNPDYTVEGKILGTYVKENLAGKKACFLGQDDDFGQDSLAGIEKILGAVVAKQTYVTSNPNVGPQMGALKSAGCEVVLLATIPGFTALSIGTAAKIGFKPQFVVSNVGSDPATVGKALGAAAPLLEGVVSANYLPLNTDDTSPWIQLFKKVNDQYNAGAEFDNNVVYGMSAAYLLVQSLQAAGKDLTRDGITAAVKKNGFQGPGLVPLRFSDKDHSGYGGEQLTKVQGGKAVFFGQAYTTDDGDGAVQPFTGQPVTPPQNGIPAA